MNARLFSAYDEADAVYDAALETADKARQVARGIAVLSTLDVTINLDAADAARDAAYKAADSIYFAACDAARATWGGKKYGGM